MLNDAMKQMNDLLGNAMPVRPVIVAGPILFGIAILLVSANPPSPAEEWERRGDIAFAASNYADALRCFETAAATTTEPGRLALKQAAACFHLGRYRDAERHFRSALETEQDAERRAEIQFNLGTALLFLSDGKDPVRLADAIRSLDRSAKSESSNEQLLHDARHNLELAKLFWKQVNQNDPPPPETEPKGGDSSTGSDAPEKRDGSESGSSPGSPGGNTGSRLVPAPGSADARPAGANGPTSPGAAQQPVHIPESEQSQPLSPAEARELLRQASERIARERRSLQKGAAAKEVRNYPDW